MHLRPALALAASAALAATLAGVPAQAESGTTTDPGPTSSRAAVQALDEVQAVLGGKSDRDMTLALRELRTQRDELVGTDRLTADRLLRRPGGDRTRDFDTVRVHWFTGDATSAYVDKVGQIADRVLGVYADAGYRPPMSDGTRGGGSGLLDIYLEDLGNQGLYGYCDSDDPPPSAGPYGAPAYCAFDNNYAEFPTHTPLENLQVTAAHELFHAVQFGYDYYEDGWFMEATATWAEDELYDDVDDNVQYLGESPLAQPRQSMDHFGGMRQYGDWIFFRYLSERFPERAGGLPVIVRRIWERADGSTASAPDDYSIQAVARVLAAQGPGLRRTWARFAAANRRPGATYDEGTANRYPVARLDATFALNGSRRDSGSIRRTIDHLAARTLRFNRSAGMRARTLDLQLDLPRLNRGPGAVATVFRASGRPTVVAIGLDRYGDAATAVDFGPGVTHVDVTLANAGIGYGRCWRGSNWSCQGTPQDDDLPFRLRATAVR